MQNIEEIRHKYFIECKKIISGLLYTENYESLIENKFKVEELTEKISFLKLLNENPELFNVQTKEIINEAELPGSAFYSEELENIVGEELVDEEEFYEETTAEETAPVFEFALNEEPVTDAVEEPTALEETETLVVNEEPIVSEFVELEEVAKEELILEATHSEETYERNVAEIEKSIDEEEDRRKIVDFEKHEEPAEKEKIFEETVVQKKPAEKKFKLAHIKGLKSVQSLFDDDPLENETPLEEPKSTGSILKSNVPTDFMEAEKPKPEFKLDLNDRIAFTKVLFNGSQTDLNEAVTTLNGFKTLEEAKEYLSDIYYKKNWKKADEYAQRLWSLVENKFQ